MRSAALYRSRVSPAPGLPSKVLFCHLSVFTLLDAWILHEWGQFGGYLGYSGLSGACGWLRLVPLYRIPSSRAPGRPCEARSWGLSFFRLTYCSSPELFLILFWILVFFFLIFKSGVRDSGKSMQNCPRKKKKEREDEDLRRGFKGN